MTPSRLVVVDGRPAVLLQPDDPAAVAYVLERAHAQHVRARRDPVPWMAALIGDLRALAALDEWVGSSSGPVPSVSVDDPASLTFMGSAEVAAACGLQVRTVRKRAAAGRYPHAQKRGRDWLIPAIDVIGDVG